MEEIELPVFGIKIKLKENSEGDYVGTVEPDLHEEGESVEEKAAFDALESMVLACACSEVDIEAPSFLAAIEMTAETICNQYS